MQGRLPFAVPMVSIDFRSFLVQERLRRAKADVGVSGSNDEERMPTCRPPAISNEAGNGSQHYDLVSVAEDIVQVRGHAYLRLPSAPIRLACLCSVCVALTSRNLEDGSALYVRVCVTSRTSSAATRRLSWCSASTRRRLGGGSCAATAGGGRRIGAGSRAGER